MRDRHLTLSILAVGMALGTAWAIRGRFGHEQGAAWAGAIGALALILAARRADWYQKAFRIAMAAAFGWGISGVMSYGMIVGYGRGTDFLNVFYGLLMLFVLGVLYGFLGGGLFGLALVDSKEHRIKWHFLLTEMVAMGLLVYAVLINQLEWFMTPPRSEMWAACLGASAALAWYIKRSHHDNVLKVAGWSAVGAGFGFSFGNFLQVMGNVTGIGFNFWNMMEYSIGFFGGIGMAYGTFTSSWNVATEVVRPGRNLVSILFVALFVPFVVWDQSFVTDRLAFVLEQGGSDDVIFYFKLAAIAAVLLVAGLALRQNYSASNRMEVAPKSVREFFILYTGLYIFLSFLVTGVLNHPVEQYLYIVNLLIVLNILSKVKGTFAVCEDGSERWLKLAVVSVVVIALLTLVAINSHDALPGTQVRFGKQAGE